MIEPDRVPVVLPAVATASVRLPLISSICPTPTLPSCSSVMPKLPASVLLEAICKPEIEPRYAIRALPEVSDKVMSVMMVDMPIVPAVSVNGLPSQPLVMKPLPA